MKNANEIARTALDARDAHRAAQQIRLGRIRKTAVFCSAFCALCMTVGGIGYFDAVRHKLPTAPTDAKTERLPEGTFPKCPAEEQEEAAPASAQPETTHAAETICTQIHLPCQTVAITTQNEPPETMLPETQPVTQAETQPLTDTPAEVQTEAQTTEEWVEEPKWNDRTIAEQFLEFSVNANTYVSRVTKISTEQTGEKLCDTQITGYDYYTETTHHADVQVYRIAGIAEECAVAVRFPGIDEGYVYTSRSYFPETLGELMDALNLTETISFHSLNPAQGESITEFDRSLLLDLLNDHRELSRIEDDTYHKPLFSVSTNVDILGIRNKSLKITEDGYLMTNIMEWGYVFFIGEETAAEIAQAFGIEAADTPIPTDTDAVVQTTPANAVITEEMVME